MKKSFLIAGLIAGLTTTSGHAVQSQVVVVKVTCPENCTLVTERPDSSSPNTLGICDCPNGPVEPTVTIIEQSPSPDTIQQVISKSMLSQAAIKNAKKTNKVSARSAEVGPKVIKKIVYEEIISDDETEQLK